MTVNALTIPLPTNRVEYVRYWTWFRLARLVVVYDVWPLPGIVQASKDEFAPKQSDDFLGFFARFLCSDLRRLASTRGLPFVSRAQRTAVDEKLLHSLACIAKSEQLGPVHCSTAQYADRVGRWISKRLPQDSDQWPEAVRDWADAVGYFFTDGNDGELPLNPWIDVWLDFPATNATDLYQFAAAVMPEKAIPIKLPSGTKSTIGGAKIKFMRLREVDPDTEPADVYGYLAGAGAAGSAMQPPQPPPPQKHTEDAPPNEERQWLDQLSSVVDDL